MNFQALILSNLMKFQLVISGKLMIFQMVCNHMDFQLFLTHIITKCPHLKLNKNLMH